MQLKRGREALLGTGQFYIQAKRIPPRDKGGVSQTPLEESKKRGLRLGGGTQASPPLTRIGKRIRVEKKI